MIKKLWGYPFTTKALGLYFHYAYCQASTNLVDQDQGNIGVIICLGNGGLPVLHLVIYTNKTGDCLSVCLSVCLFICSAMGGQTARPNGLKFGG